MVTLKKDGFTIVELLIVIVVIAILAAITIVAFNGVQQQAIAASVSSGVGQAQRQLALYKVDNDAYPTSGSLSAAVTKNDTVAFQYTSNGTTYCLTGTQKNIAFRVSDTSGNPAEGVCAGHTQTGAPQITNVLTNPGVEAGQNGWIFTRGTISVSEEQAHSGSKSLKMFSPAVNNDVYVETLMDLPAGTWTVSAHVYLTSAAPSYISRDAFCCTPGGPTTVPYDRTKLNQWQRVSATYVYTAPTQLRLRLSAIENSVMYVDSVMVTAGNTVYPYADGNSAFWKWDGASGNSQSSGPVQP